MKKRKLNYHIYNPNTKEETADYILKLFVEVNENKLNGVLQEKADEIGKEEDNKKEHSA